MLTLNKRKIARIANLARRAHFSDSDVGGVKVLTLGFPEADEVVRQILEGPSEELEALMSTVESLSDQEIRDLIAVMLVGRDKVSLGEAYLSADSLGDRHCQNGFILDKSRLSVYLKRGLESINAS